MNVLSKYSKRIKRELLWVITFIIIMWVVFIIDRVLPLELFGLRPRSLMGIAGLITMPFLHGDLSHILSNTIPLIVLLILLISSRENSFQVVVGICAIGGALLWSLGNGNTLHIGASLLVFGLAGFLLTNGFFFEPKVVSTAISFFVLVSYGGALLAGVAPWQKGISWDGHLYGFAAGALTAYLLAKRQ